MKILFYGAKDYDQQFFDKLKPEYPNIEFVFIESNLYKETASLAAGYDQRVKEKSRIFCNTFPFCDPEQDLGTDQTTHQAPENK